MSLETGALKVGRGPRHFRPKQGGIHDNSMSRNRPWKQLPTGTVTLNQISGKITNWSLIVTEKSFETSEEMRGMGT